MSFSRRQFLQAGGSVALVAVAGCDDPSRIPGAGLLGTGDPLRGLGPLAAPDSDAIDPLQHVLDRLSFGARPEDRLLALRRVHAGPVRTRTASASSDRPDPPASELLEEAAFAHVESQLAPEQLDGRRAWWIDQRFDELHEPVAELYNLPHEHLLRQMSRRAILQAVHSPRQLQEVMVGFWCDHFNIDPSKADCKWLAPAWDRDVIREHAMGKFPELLRATALGAAMLWYLDQRENRKATETDRANENYARELLELHTLGVHGGYVQNDVMEVARCLSGWTVQPMKGLAAFGAGEEAMWKGRVEFVEKHHDDGPKKVLGHEIAAGGGAGDLDVVLKILVEHPSTARHLATKLARRFVADNPPEGAVASGAAAFAASGGDVRATLAAIFATDDFKNSARAKFKRPFHFVVSALRATDAITDAGEPIHDYLLRMGHAPYNYPTPDGQPEEAFPWMGTLLGRWNFASALAAGRLKGTRARVERLVSKLGGEDAWSAHLLGRRPDALEREAFRAIEAEESGEGAGEERPDARRLRSATALLLASPGFQRF